MSEKVKVIDIDTGQSAKTLKELKEEIKNLRKELDNCEIGSDKFVSTLDELSDAQDKLKKATKSSNEALEGSYDSLVQKMGELKKAWRATADEAERADLGSQIAEINQQLKDMDADIGNYQRNVGNYGSAFDDLNVKFEDGVAKFERMNKTTQDVVGSFDLVEGGLKAIGIESEAVNGMMDKLNGVMKMTQGFDAVKEGVKSFRMLKVATNGATVATNGFKKALIATGIGALIVLIGTLIAYWDDLAKAFGNSEQEINSIKGAVDDLKTSLSNFDENNNFLVRLAEAAGKSREEIFQLRMEQARLAHDQSVAAVDAMEAKVSELRAKEWWWNGKSDELIAAEESLAELKEIEEERYQATKKILDDMAVYEEEKRTKAREDEKKAQEDAKNDAIEKLKEEKKEAASIAEEARKAVIDSQEEELAEAERIYKERLAMLQRFGHDTTALTEAFEKEKLDIIKKYADMQADAESQRIAEAEAIGTKALNELKRGVSTSQTNSAAKQSDVESKYANEALTLPEDATIKAIELEIAKTLELQAVRAAAFDEQMAQMQAVLDSGLLTAEQQAELQAEYDALQQEKIQATRDANAQITGLNKELLLQQQADNRQMASNITTTFTTALTSVQSILSAVQSNIDTSNKEGFEKSKKLQIASATIGMLVGITNAVSGLFTTKSGPWDIALAAIQAAAIATTGGIQIAQIKKQTYEGGSSTGNLNPPSINTAALMSSPINYTTEIQGANAMEDVADTRVYVVESDISDTVKKVQVAEDESTY